MTHNDKIDQSRPPIATLRARDQSASMNDGEMDRIYGVLDRLFEDYWQGTDKHSAGATRQTLRRVTAEADRK